MRAIQTPGSFSGLAGAPRLLPTAAESNVLVYETAIKEWLVPRDNLLRLPTATRGVKVQGKASGTVWEAQAPSTIMSVSGGVAGVEFSGGASAGLLSDFEMPASYTVITVVELDVLGATIGALLSSVGAVAADGTFLLWVANTGYVRLQHGASYGIQTGTGLITANTKTLIYASFDAGTLTAAIGINKLTPPTTGTIGVQHGGSGRTFIGLSSDGGYLDGHVFETLILDRAFHLAAYDTQRQALLTTIAGVYGITLT